MIWMYVIVQPRVYLLKLIHVIKSILVGVVYRPPNHPVDDLLTYINDILQIVYTEKKLLYLMGDLNITILNVGNVQYVDKFLDTMLSNSIFPPIKYLTSVSSN